MLDVIGCVVGCVVGCRWIYCCLLLETRIPPCRVEGTSVQKGVSTLGWWWMPFCSVLPSSHHPASVALCVVNHQCLLEAIRIASDQHAFVMPPKLAGPGKGSRSSSSSSKEVDERKATEEMGKTEEIIGEKWRGKGSDEHIPGLQTDRAMCCFFFCKLYVPSVGLYLNKERL